MERERRKFRRVKSEFNISVRENDEDTNNTIAKYGKTYNVSACGVLFEYSEKLEIGKFIHLRFLTPNSFDFFEGDARVVRIEISPDNTRYEIGVEFYNLDDKDKQELDYYLTIDSYNNY